MDELQSPQVMSAQEMLTEKEYKMKIQKKEASMKKIDLMLLREKGMTKSKISKLIGVPVEFIDQQLNEQKQYKKYSGIF